MPNLEAIANKVIELKKKYEETDPVRLCEAMDIVLNEVQTPISPNHFKGMFLMLSRVKVITLNAALRGVTKKIVLCHEIGHCVLHEELVPIRSFSDFDLFGMVDETEFEANAFAAEFMLEDDDVMSVINDDVTFFGAAKILGVPPELLDFKFRVMKKKGYALTPMYLSDSRYLKRI